MSTLTVFLLHPIIGFLGCLIFRFIICREPIKTSYWLLSILLGWVTGLIAVSGIFATLIVEGGDWCSRKDFFNRKF